MDFESGDHLSCANFPDMNPWASLPNPLKDIFLLEIASVYLTVRDLLQLSEVSWRYRDLFSPRWPTGNKVLKNILLREAEHKVYSSSDGNRHLIVHEQLPTIGSFSQVESLDHDALLVAQLRSAALRRRDLIRLDIQQPPQPDTVDVILEEKLQQVLFKHKPISPGSLPQELYDISKQQGSRFMCVNMSGVDIYVHRIDDEGRVFDGVPIQSGNTSNSLSSFAIPSQVDNGGRLSLPSPVFCGEACIMDSFVLSFKEGGPPFSIYRVKRIWGAILKGRVRHIPAIAVLPGVRVQELCCDMDLRLKVNLSLRERGEALWGVFIRDRNTGIRVVTEDNSKLLCTKNNTTFMTQRTFSSAPESESALNIARDGAKTFYGLNVPSFPHPLWYPRWDRLEMASHLGSQIDPINYPTMTSQLVFENLFERIGEEFYDDTDDESAHSTTSSMYSYMAEGFYDYTDDEDY